MRGSGIPGAWLLFFVLLLCSGRMVNVPVGAQTEGGKPGEESKGSLEELAELSYEYEMMIAGLSKPVKTLCENYVERLKAISKDLQERGDLGGVLLVQEEIKSIEKSGGPVAGAGGSTEPAQLAAARSVFMEEKGKLERSILEKTSKVTAAYGEKLSALKVLYTQQGRIDDALAVKEILDGLSAGDIADDRLASQPAGAGKRSLKIRVQVDGSSHLFMRGSEIWFDHTEGRAKAPGRHGGEFPTLLNDEIEWMPVWKDLVTEPYDTGVGFPTRGAPVKLKLRQSEGRGTAEVVEQPSASNGYTAKISLRDETRAGKRFLGSEWIEFRLDW